MAKSIEVKVYLSREECDRLNQEATALSVTRGQLIRERALGQREPSERSSVTPEMYMNAVNRAARTVSGLPRPQLEAIVASVVIEVSQTTSS